MSTLRRCVEASIGAFAGGMLVAGTVLAQAPGFPAQPVRIVVPTAAGGGLDIVARQVGQRLAELWGQQVVVDNRAGAGGTIGAEVVARAAPDGHTLALVSSSFAINASLYPRLTYDSARDFAPVSLVVMSPLVLVVNPSLPTRTMAELVALARARPGQISYASTGSGGVVHLATELLKNLARVDLLHVPYKGTVPAVTDVIGGQVGVTITGLPVARPHVANGRLRALAVTGSRRSVVMADLPTIGESVRGYELDNWFGVLAPGATPRDIVARLNAGIARALDAADVRQKLLAQGDEPAANAPEAFASMLRAELAKYARLVRETGARAE